MVKSHKSVFTVIRKCPPQHPKQLPFCIPGENGEFVVYFPRQLMILLNEWQHHLIALICIYLMTNYIPSVFSNACLPFTSYYMHCLLRSFVHFLERIVCFLMCSFHSLDKVPDKDDLFPHSFL